MLRSVLLITPNQLWGVQTQVALMQTGAIVQVASTVAQGLRMAHRAPPQVIVVAGTFPDLDMTSLCLLLKSAPETRQVLLLVVADDGHVQEVLLERRAGGAPIAQAVPLDSTDLSGVIQRLSGGGAAPAREGHWNRDEVPLSASHTRSRRGGGPTRHWWAPGTVADRGARSPGAAAVPASALAPS